MRYLMCSDKNGSLEILNIYSSEEEALKRLKYHMKKEKCILKIIPIPVINVGGRIYKKDGAYYGTIAYETNTLWGISERDKKEDMPNPYSKQRIDQWIIGRDFIVLDGEEFAEVDDMLNMMSELNSKVQEVLKKLEHINAEQVGLFQKCSV